MMNFNTPRLLGVYHKKDKPIPEKSSKKSVPVDKPFLKVGGVPYW